MGRDTVLFDLDGTLLNTLDDLADSMNEGLGIMGFAPHPVEAYRRFVGNGIKMLAERTLPAGENSEENVQRLRDIFNGIYDRRCFNKTKPYDGINELLQSLTERGVRMFVVSNKPHGFTVEIVKRYFGDIFTGIMGNSDRFPPKPAPDVIFHIIEKYGIIKEKALFVGDSDADMETSVNSGIDGAGVLWGFRDEEELRANGARFIVSKPSELLKLI